MGSERAEGALSAALAPCRLTASSSTDTTIHTARDMMKL